MSITLQIKIDEEYFDLVPRPTKEQRRSLKQSIKDEGQLEPITVNQDGVILDGHTRFEILEELGIKPEYVVKEFKNKDAERMFAVTVNVKRRQLTDFQVVDLISKELELIRLENKHDAYSDMGSAKEPKSKKTRQERSAFRNIANEIGVCSSMIEKCLYLKKYGSPEMIHSLRNGETNPTTASKTLASQRKTLPLFKRTNKTRNARKIDSVFRFCPVCGTQTLRPAYGQKLIPCSNCNWYYALSRRIKDDNERFTKHDYSLDYHRLEFEEKNNTQNTIIPIPSVKAFPLKRIVTKFMQDDSDFNMVELLKCSRHLLLRIEKDPSIYTKESSGVVEAKSRTKIDGYRIFARTQHDDKIRYSYYKSTGGYFGYVGSNHPKRLVKLGTLENPNSHIARILSSLKTPHTKQELRVEFSSIYIKACIDILSFLGFIKIDLSHINQGKSHSNLYSQTDMEEKPNV